MVLLILTLVFGSCKNNDEFGYFPVFVVIISKEFCDFSFYIYIYIYNLKKKIIT